MRFLRRSLFALTMLVGATALHAEDKLPLLDEAAIESTSKSLTAGRRYQVLFGADLDVIGALKMAPDVELLLTPARTRVPANYPLAMEAVVGYIDAGEVAEVQFVDGSAVIPTTVDSNYRATHIWPSSAIGAHQLLARVTDSDGVVTDSAPVAVTVFNSTVAGQVEGVFTEGTGRVIRGWACSKGIDASITVELHFGASTAATTNVASAVANRASDATIATACEAGGAAYRYSFSITTAMYTTYSGQPIHVRGMSPVGATHAWLSGSGQYVINHKPVVTGLTASAPDASPYYIRGQSVTFTAATSDADDSVASVNFYVDGVLEATVTASPAGFKYSWTAVNNAHEVTAQAFDSRGAPSDSRSLAVTVATRPTVALTAPAAGAIAFTDEVLTVSANASDDRQVTRVEFLATRGSLIESLGVDTSAPYALSWSGMAASQYQLQAVAYDDQGLHTTSAARNVDVRTRPAIMIAAPDASQSTIPVGQALMFSVSVSGQFDRVELLDVTPDGTTVLPATRSGNTFSYSWTPSVGQHMLTARVIVNGRGTVKSDSRTITVGTPPNVTLSVGPAPHYVNETIRLSATATDGNGIKEVLFFVDGVQQGGVLSSAPYYVDWTPESTKNYDIRVEATDNEGLTSWAESQVQVKVRPAITITSPGAGQAFTSGNSVTLSASVSGEVTSVQFVDCEVTPVQFVDNCEELRAFSGGATYSHTWQPNSGSHTLTVNALVGATIVDTETRQIQVITDVVYIHTDALGSVVAVTDANRNVIERREWEPYGKQITPAVSDGPGYTGHVSDAATGLVYMQQRYYDPGVGRFLSVDPIGVSPSSGANFNRYWYANNNPYRFVDPDGRAAETPWDIFNVGLGSASFAFNLAAGNYVGAAIDAAGLAYDGVATGVPFLPGGASTTINIVRFSKLASSVVSSSAKLAKAFAGNAKVASLQRSIANNIKDHLSPMDIAGAVKDILGKPVSKPGGGHYDHLDEVTNALGGLRNSMREMKSMLSSGKLSDAQRSAVNETLGQVSEHVDRVEKILSVAR